jgi:hypothetical protein
VVFVGYSLRDDDIRQVIGALRDDLNSAARPAYFVHPNPAFAAPLPGAEVIHTSAAYFVELLDQALVRAGYLLPLTIYDRAATIDQRLREARSRVDDNVFPWKYPLAILNHAFQDGLADAMAHATATRRTGNDRIHGHLVQLARNYYEARQRATRARNYWDAAYIDGYEAGLIALGSPDMPLQILPLYYCPGVGPVTSFKTVAQAIRSGPTSHRAAYAWAARRTERLPKDFYLYHPPFLTDYTSVQRGAGDG